MTKIIPKIYVTRFFQLVTSRQFAEAERILERLKQKMQMNERNRGYFQALYGMLLAQRSNDDRYAFLSNLNIKDKKELHTYRREFLLQSEHRLHADYDKGFFSAWADYMRILPKLETIVVSLPNKNHVEKEAEVTGTQREIEAEESKEARKEEREEIKIETKIEEEKTEIEKVEEIKSTEKIEPRQRTLVDFAK